MKTTMDETIVQCGCAMSYLDKTRIFCLDFQKFASILGCSRIYTYFVILYFKIGFADLGKLQVSLAYWLIWVVI